MRAFGLGGRVGLGLARVFQVGARRRPSRIATTTTAAAIAVAVAVAIAGTGPSRAAGPGDWPQWRGPDGQGHSAVAGLPLTWSETNNLAWKTAIPGRGHSSPVIGGGQVWVTTALETPASPETVERRKKADTGGQPLNILDEVVLRAVALDLQTGAVRHDVELIRERDPQWVHQQNSYASPTPVLDGDRLYAHFGTFGTACVDTRTGRVVWLNREVRLMHENGPGSSPVVWGNLVIFHGDGSDAQFVAALDKTTGALVWRSTRSGEMGSHPQTRKAYGTPLVAEFRGRPELLSTGANWLYSYDPASGSELWKLSYETLGFSIVPRPVLGHGMIFFSTSFMRAELLAVRYDGTRPAEIAWRWKRGVPQTSSPILVGDELYFVSDSGGLLTCLDARTGQEHYQERLGGNFAASPTCADGRLYFHDRDGVTTVVKPGKTFEVLARNVLDGPHMASAAIADRSLFLRTDKAVYRIRSGKTP